MFPLGTDRPLNRPTVVTFLLIALNLIVFGVQMYLQATDIEAFRRFMELGSVWGLRFHWWSLITSAFIHVGAWHIFGNMLALWVFGPNIEDRLGRFWFLLFYLGGAAASGGLHATFSDAPAVGASGAIAAVTGAYLVMFPRTMVKCFSFMMGIGLVQLPAWWFIGFAVVWDFIMQGTGRMGGRGTNIAHLAHIGGYMFGIGVAFMLLWLKIVPREQWDLFSQGRQMWRRRQIKSAAVMQDRATAQHWERAKSGVGGSVVGPAETEKFAVLRAEIAKRIAASDLPGAAAAYKQLADGFAHVPGATLLSRNHQLDIGNWFYQQKDSDAAAFAYARFLEGYPKDPESATVRLLLGMIHARSLNDPVKAKALIAQAIGELRDPGAVDMAKRELAALG